MSASREVRGVTHRSPLERNAKAQAVHQTVSANGPAHPPDRHISRPIPVSDVAGFDHLALEHLGATIGTVVHGIDMARTTDAEVALLRQLLLERRVLFFRDQFCSEAQHIAFGARFGKLEVHPFNPMHADHEEIIPINSDRRHVGTTNTWHSDVMWRMEPSLGSILRARTIPAVGGDTLFADMAAAYRGLPPAQREQIDGLMAVNSGSANGSKERARNRLAERGATATELADFDTTYADVPIPVHPVVRTHPETGERAIYVNAAFTRRIVGLDEPASRTLLDHLFAQAATPEYQCRFRWERGSVAFWDNRVVQHYGSSDYWPEPRRMERVTIVGDLPYFRGDDGETMTTYADDTSTDRAGVASG